MFVSSIISVGGSGRPPYRDDDDNINDLAQLGRTKFISPDSSSHAKSRYRVFELRF